MNFKEEIYTTDDVAQKLKITKRTVYNYMKQGKLKGRKIGVYWYFSEEDIKNFLETGTSERKPAPPRPAK